jgi:hypothetical protein
VCNTLPIRSNACAGQSTAQRDPYRLLLELFSMLDHLVGLPVREFNSQMTDAKSLQVRVVNRLVQPTDLESIAPLNPMDDHIYKGGYSLTVIDPRIAIRQWKNGSIWPICVSLRKKRNIHQQRVLDVAIASTNYVPSEQNSIRSDPKT